MGMVVDERVNGFQNLLGFVGHDDSYGGSIFRELAFKDSHVWGKLANSKIRL